MRNILIAVSFVLLLLTAACQNPTGNSNDSINSNSAGNNNSSPGEPGTKAPPENVVTMVVPEVNLKPGGDGEAQVNLTIAPGYHIHANPATLKNLIATTLTVTPPPGFTAATPTYPPAKTIKFKFDDTPLAVYAETATIAVKLHLDSKQPVGSQNVPAKLKYQACDDNACYPPKTIDVTIPASVKIP